MGRVADGGERAATPPTGGSTPRHTGEWVLRTNSVSFYLRSRVVLESERLRVAMHRTILGLVPLGKVSRDVPLADLEGVAVRVVVRPARVVVSVGLAAVAVLAELPSVLRVGCVVLSLAMLFLGISLGIRVQGRARAPFVIPVCVLQRHVAGAAVRQIRRALAARSAS